MSQIKSHRDCIVWQKAIKLVVLIYSVSKGFPQDEKFGLTSQMRRAAVSIPANIAEGQGRRLPKEFQMFLGHARGSFLELDTHLEIALQIGYLSADKLLELQEKIAEVGRLLNGLLRSIHSNI